MPSESPLPATWAGLGVLNSMLGPPIPRSLVQACLHRTGVPYDSPLEGQSPWDFALITLPLFFFTTASLSIPLSTLQPPCLSSDLMSIRLRATKAMQQFVALCCLCFSHEYSVLVKRLTLLAIVQVFLESQQRWQWQALTAVALNNRLPKFALQINCCTTGLLGWASSMICFVFCSSALEVNIVQVVTVLKHLLLLSWQ